MIISDGGPLPVPSRHQRHRVGDDDNDGIGPNNIAPPKFQLSVCVSVSDCADELYNDESNDTDTKPIDK